MTTASTIWPILTAWGSGEIPTIAQRDQVMNWMVDPERAAAWQVDRSSISAALDSRIRLLQSIIRQLNSGVELPLPGDWTEWIEPMWTLWLPLALRIDRTQRHKASHAQHCLVQGILGGQGTGKTTLSRILQLLLNMLGQEAAVMSIDDLYLTYAERCKLKRQDPRFVWRGPPGTHDVDLGIRTFKQIGHATPGQQVELPRFDKSLYGGQGDRTQPTLTTAPTVILFEGWCVGAQPLDADAFADLSALPKPIDTEADRLFARECNARLMAYLPLWEYLDSLIVLQPEDYRFSRQWRQQAERQMIARGKSGLLDSEVAAFVTYFWQALHPQLFITPLTRSDCTDLVITLNQDHRVSKLALPSSGGTLKPM
ncbi:MAG: glycerate kinase [Cyanobacteria bacterium P01_D01_bin.1]